MLRRSYASRVPSETVERLSYELSFDQIVRQERALDELRARTGTLLTASAVVASFLGSTAVSIGGHAWLTALGFAAFATSISAASYVLLPKRGLVFSLKGGVLLREGSGEPLQDVHRRLAHWFDAYSRANQDTIERLYRFFAVATVAVLVEAMLWLLEIAL